MLNAFSDWKFSLHNLQIIKQDFLENSNILEDWWFLRKWLLNSFSFKVVNSHMLHLNQQTVEKLFFKESILLFVTVSRYGFAKE